jgi:hypothetical protein
MWYSWKGHDNPSSFNRSATQGFNTNVLPTILNQRHTLYADGSFSPLPPALHLGVLWPIFLKNVHPLSKIFFDWEIAPIIQKARERASALSIEEEALVNGIRFVATLTLSDEECQSSLSESRHQLLQQCQRSTEFALTKTEYSETTDKRVLQAFMLYIVSAKVCCKPVLRPDTTPTVSNARPHTSVRHTSTYGYRRSCC